MKKSAILLFFIFVGIQLYAQKPMSAFKAANGNYENNNYEGAINSYESLLSSGYSSADLHYNLANAYYKKNQLSKAILHFEKALKIEPGFEDAAYNLEIANSKTIDKVDAIPDLFIYRWWKSIYSLFSVKMWTNLLFFFLFIALVGFSLYFLSYQTKSKKIGFYIASSTLFLALFSWGMAAVQNKNLHNSKHAIIMQPTVNINSSPSTGSSKLFVLHKGTKVRIEDRKEAWVNIALPNGNKGWIKSEMIEGI